MANDSSMQGHQLTGKNVLHQIGIGLVAMAALFVVIGIIVRMILILNQ